MLTKSGQYALQAVTYIAEHEGRWLHARDVGRELGIPAHFLGKLLGALVREQVLLSQRGRRGGFRLAQPITELTLARVLRPFERRLKECICLLSSEVCSPETPCPLHHQWPRIEGRLVALLERTKLADIMTPEPAPPEQSAGRRRS